MTALKDKFTVVNIAPGHCTGEPTFAALKKAFGMRYIYAGLGTSLVLGPDIDSKVRRGEAPNFDDFAVYRRAGQSRTLIFGPSPLSLQVNMGRIQVEPIWSALAR